MLQLLKRLCRDDEYTKNCSIFITSGYFNFTKTYQDLIISTTCPVSIVCAAPQANGFYKSKGFSRYIPDVYSFIEKQFFNKTKKLGNISLREYFYPGWTFHCKGKCCSSGQAFVNGLYTEGLCKIIGFWITLPNETKPSISLVGSSNYGYRSVDESGR